MERENSVTLHLDADDGSRVGRREYVYRDGFALAFTVQDECLILYIEPGEDARAAAGNHIAKLVEDPDIGSKRS